MEQNEKELLDMYQKYSDKFNHLGWSDRVARIVMFMAYELGAITKKHFAEIDFINMEDVFSAGLDNYFNRCMEQNGTIAVQIDEKELSDIVNVLLRRIDMAPINKSSYRMGCVVKALYRVMESTIGDEFNAGFEEFELDQSNAQAPN